MSLKIDGAIWNLNGTVENHVYTTTEVVGGDAE
jgi:hypothetical protein